MPPSSRTFRIFVSSTFSDLAAERDALQHIVFPRLRELAMTHGCRFQAIDLRWGVSEEAALDQQTMKICLGEIERCQKVSPRPNFIVLLGDRFGWRPLPAAIPAEEFEQLLTFLSEDLREQLCWKAEQPSDEKGWYRRDDNAVPPEYILQPRLKGGRYKSYEAWYREVEQPLVAALEGAARQASLDDAALVKYTFSATGQEIVDGALKIADAQGHVFGFLRSIANPEEALKSEEGKLFIETDLVLQLRQQELKNRLREHLPGNIYEYAVSWQNDQLQDSHIGRLPETLDACLQLLEGDHQPMNLCEAVWLRLARVLLSEINQLETLDALAGEQDAHRHFGEERARWFTGRGEVLAQIAAYLSGNTTCPLVLWGDSGSGKSALMAKAIQNTDAAGTANIIISRFIGATPESSDGRSLLESLSRQILRVYGKDESSLRLDFSSLANDFAAQLALATEARPLVVFLDALDQLANRDNARSLTWLPVELPPFVKLVVSTLPGKCLQALQRRLPDQAFLQVPALGRQDGEALLRQWLEQAGRKLTGVQHSDILEKFEAGGGLPLYLKLAFEEARHWHAYDGLPALSDRLPGLAGDIPGIIGDLFWRLEQESHHGRVLVSHALGYLSAARNGLSEDELLAVLWQDEVVKDDFFRRSIKSPKDTHQLPVVIWSRLYLDLEAYLSVRQADGAALLGFYHRQVAEAAQAKYRSQERHAGLSAYFSQSPLYLDQEAREPDLRKLSEMVFQQAWAGQPSQVQQALLDYQYLRAKLAGQGAQALIADYDLLSEAGVSPEKGETLMLLQGALRISASELDRDHTQLPGHLTGRLLGFEDPDLIHLLGQIRQETHHPWVRPLQPCFEAPGGALQFNFTHETEITALAVTPDGQKVITGTGPYHPTLRIWDVASGNLLLACHLTSGTVWAIAVTPDNRQVLALAIDQNRSEISVWDLETGNCLRTMFASFSNCMALTPDGKKVVAGCLGGVRVYDLSTFEPFDLGAYIHNHRKDVLDIAVTPDGKTAISASEDYNLKVWDLASGALLHTLQGHTGWVYKVVVSSDGRLAASGCYDGTARIWDITTGECLAVYGKGIIGRIFKLSFLPDDLGLVTVREARFIEVWDLASGNCHLTISGEDFLTLVGSQYLVSASAELNTAPCVKIWSLKTKECVQTWYGHAKKVTRALPTPDGKRLATSSLDNTLKIWDLEQVGAVQRSSLQDWHPMSISAMKYIPHGNQAVSCANDGSIKIWNAENGACLRTLEGHTGSIRELAVTPDGRRAITASYDQTLRLWDLATGEILQTRPLKNFILDLLVFSTDGRRAFLYPVTSKKELSNAFAKQYLLSMIHFRRKHSRGIVAKSAAIASSGRRAIIGYETSTIQVWDTLRGRWLRVLWGRRDELTAAAVSPDGRWGAAWTKGTLFQKGKWIVVWDLQTGKRRYGGPAHNPYVISADGELFAAYVKSMGSDYFGALCFYDTHTGNFERSVSQLREYALTPDFLRVVSGSNNILSIWAAESGKKDMKKECSLLGITPNKLAIDEQGLLITMDDGSSCKFFRLENMPALQPVYTAWSCFSASHFWKGFSLAFDCSYCAQWFEIQRSDLGKVVTCPGCGRSIKLNSYTVRDNWRRVARAWKGEHN
jgi:WD40 repeat protein